MKKFSYIDQADINIVNSINKLDWEKESIDGETIYIDPEDLHTNIIGIAAMQLFNLKTGKTKDEAFRYAIQAEKILNGQETNIRNCIGENIGSDSDALYEAAYLVQSVFKGNEYIKNGIKERINASSKEKTELIARRFKEIFKNHGQIEFGHHLIGFYGECLPGGYIDCVGDDAIFLIDMGIGTGIPSKPEQLRILSWYALALGACDSIAQNIKWLVIYRPRSNALYKIALDKIPDSLMQDILMDILEKKANTEGIYPDEEIEF